MKGQPKFYTVPANTPHAECKAKECRATIYFIPGKTGNIPIDCDVEGGIEPTEEGEGWGVSHFTTCSAANRFSKSGRK